MNIERAPKQIPLDRQKYGERGRHTDRQRQTETDRQTKNRETRYWAS